MSPILPVPDRMTTPAPCAACDGRPGGCADCRDTFDAEAMARCGRDEDCHGEGD